MTTLLIIVSVLVTITEGYISQLSQYHIQSDTGEERFFKFKTENGQFRKERRLTDGTVIGMSSWIDANGNQHVQEYKADGAGFRVMKSYTQFVGLVTEQQKPQKQQQSQLFTSTMAAFTKQQNRHRERSRRRQQLYVAAASTTQRPLSTRRAAQGPATKTTTAASPSPSPSSSPTTVTSSTTTAAKKWPGRKRVVIKKRKMPRNRNNETEFSSDPIYDHKRGANSGPKTRLKMRQNYVKMFNESVVEHDDPANGQFHYQAKNHANRNEVLGQYGYVDPFGIRRVVYYFASPKTGYLHAKDNRFVGAQNI